MKNVIILLLIVLTTQVWGQSGYVKMDNDSTLVGFLRYYVSAKDGHQGFELWRTKKDKNPLKIPKHAITEYAIKKDTFKVLHQFKPFDDAELYFETIDARRESSGKVNLYTIEYYQNANVIMPYTGGVRTYSNPWVYTFIYILEDREGFVKALPAKREMLKEALMNFFPEKYVLKYEEVNGAIQYKSIPELVKLYNSK
jgi:hypothetical protein